MSLRSYGFEYILMIIVDSNPDREARHQGGRKILVGLDRGLEGFADRTGYPFSLAVGSRLPQQ